MTMRPAPFQRLADLAIALPVFALALPICIVLLALIRLESKGAPLFVQERVGRNGKIFRMLKLRTMRADTAQLASHLVTSSSITRLGGLLRRLKLDELPQLWNVIVGSMSLVGPRPCLPNQHELIAAREAYGLFAIRPGITGPAQVAGIDMSDPGRLADCEAQYFSSAGRLADLQLVVSTIFGRGRGDAALISRDGDIESGCKRP